jgi:hypothetical protein
MKIGGIEVKGPNEELLVLPRGDQQIVIRARAVLDMETFEKLCPEPKPPGKRTKDGFVPNPDDPGYKSVLEAYQNKRLAYLVIKTLEPSEIEWTTVNIDNPSTWTNYMKDLHDGGLSNIEINRVIVCVMQANALDEKKLEEARKLFLRGQVKESEESSGQSTEQVTMPSGEPVNASA